MTSLLHQFYPQGIQTTIQRRLNRLPEAMQHLLTAAAVAGRQIDPAVLRQLIVRLGFQFELHDWLLHCISVVILEIHKGHSRFADEELRLSLLDVLSDSERRAWHEQIATTMETIYLHDPVQAESLAYHWQQVGNIPKEQRYARVAGEYAWQQFAHDTAVHHLSRALTLTPVDNFTEQYELLLTREQIYHLLGDRDAQKDDLTRLAEIADLLSSESGQEWRTEVALRLGSFAEVTGEYTVAIVAASEAHRLAVTTQSPAHEAASHLLWGQALLRQGKYDEATDKLQVSLAQARSHQISQTEADSLRFLGVVAADLSQFDQARQYYEEALALYGTLQDKRGESTVLNNLSVVAYSQNQLVAAIEHWEEARQIYKTIGDKEGSARVLSNLSTVCMDLGEYQTGRAYSEEALLICRDIDLRFGQAFNLINLSLFSFYLQAEQQADMYGQAALMLAREMESLPLEGMALKDRAYILMFQQQWPEANQAYHQALAIWQQLSQPLQILEAQAGLARVALLQGDLELAQTTIEPVMAYLQAGNTPIGSSRPFIVYLVCYEILAASDDPYAQTLLEQAHQQLQEYAQGINDPQKRHSFLEKVATHKELNALFIQYANL